jgi:hypothetical protein
MVEKSASQALWPNLSSATPAEQQPRNSSRSSRGGIADAMWKSLVPKPRDPRREALLRNLDELNAKVRGSRR